MKAGEYIIVKYGLKTVLAQSTGYDPKGKTGKCRLETNIGDDPVIFDFERDDVVATLGKSPTQGSVYGVQVEPLIQTLGNHPFWGEVQLYVNFDDDQIRSLKKEMGKFAKELQRRKMPKLPLVVQVRNKKGKQVGMYRHTGKDVDYLIVRPSPDIVDIDYIFGHEYGHGVWFRCMTPKQRLSWIKAYHSTITIHKSDDVESFLEGVVSNGDIKSYMRELAEDQVAAYKACFRYIKTVHGLNSDDIQLMLTYQDDISPYWPKSVEFSEKDNPLGLYAAKDVKEFFAEAMAFHLKGMKLPKNISSLLEKTLQRLDKTSKV